MIQNISKGKDGGFLGKMATPSGIETLDQTEELK